MKTVKRFRSFEEMKASEVNADPDKVILARHRALQKLMAVLRSQVIRKGDLTRQ